MLSPSALLIAIMSASSTRPFLMPCNSSPAPGSISARKKSVMSQTAVSDWPMPTVSTSTTSKPAASHSSMVSRVLAATPPSVPEEGEGRMKALSDAASRAIRVLSPRIEPPVRAEEGSTASTATLWPLLDQVHAERVDGGGLADAGRAGDADADRLAGVGQQRLHQIARRGLMIGAPALDQRDGARQRRAVAARGGPLRVT